MGKRIVIKNILFSIIRQTLQLIYGFIVPIILIKEFGSSTNGLVSSISQFLAYITFLDAGIGPIIKNALFKPLVKKNNEELANILGSTDKFFKRIAYIFIIYLIVLCVIYPYLVNNSFSQIYTISLILILSLSTFFEYFLGMTYKLFLQADQKNYIIEIINGLGYILNLIVIIILVKLNCNIQIVKLVSSLVYISKPIFLKLYFQKNYNIKINKLSNYKFEKQWDGVSHHIAATVQGNIDVAVLTAFSNLINVSIYSVYSLVTNGIRMIIVSLTSGIDSFFGKMMVSENKNDVNKKFEIYSFIFYTITTILLSCSLILINPFIEIYTAGIKDANYVNPVFSYILIFAEFNFVIRYPFSTLVYARGHFKETKKSAILEPIVNIILSILFVKRLGLIGVAIGTLISMLIRSLAFISYASKNILKVKLMSSMKIIIISFVELLIFFISYLFVDFVKIKNYVEWILLAFVVFILVSLIVLVINILLNKKIVINILNRGEKNAK